ncbi:MAG: PAS domain-containing protein [Anaerolineaceae bacterium]|nr:PAS domain-containing protein [Anaerolineaceae bacterium]
MNQNEPEYPLNFELSKSEGIESILTLLNLIPDPAIIYQRGVDRILAANNALFLLTSLEEKDFLDQGIHALLPNILDTNPITGHGQKSRLRHKRQPMIQVSVRIFSLSKSTDNLIIILRPEDMQTREISKPADQTGLVDKIHTLFQAREQDNLKSVLAQVLDTSCELLTADVVCLYKASGSVPQLSQYLASDDKLGRELPDPLTSEDLSNTQEAFLWTAEDLARNQLQKTAASANYRYLIAVPLGQDNARFGLFVAGSKTEKPLPHLLPMAKMLATYIAALMEDQIALQNTRNLANKVKQVVRIQNEIISNLEEGILILSPDLTIAEINRAAEDMLGYANVEAIRQPVDNILIGSESFGSALSSAKEGYPTLVRGDLTLHHRSGKSFPAQVMTTPVMSNGKLVSIIVVIRDTSQAAESQAQQKQLEQRAILGEVTAIFAHEVRNPLNAITLSLQLMEENLEGDEENLQWISKIQKECDNLIELMDSVLSFSKPLEYKMSSVNLNQMVNQLLDRWRPRLLRVNVTPYFESEVEKPFVQGDQRALEQVFTNLISNAINAMSQDGGYLGIRITEAEKPEDEQFLQINITDSGPGIPADIKEHIFKPFITGSKHGTGLGLAITQRIITAHKGKIEVESFPGGTIFKVFLNKEKEPSQI